MRFRRITAEQFADLVANALILALMIGIVFGCGIALVKLLAWIMSPVIPQ